MGLESAGPGFAFSERHSLYKVEKGRECCRTTVIGKMDGSGRMKEWKQTGFDGGPEVRDGGNQDLNLPALAE